MCAVAACGINTDLNDLLQAIDMSACIFKKKKSFQKAEENRVGKRL